MRLFPTDCSGKAMHVPNARVRSVAEARMLKVVAELPREDSVPSIHTMLIRINKLSNPNDIKVGQKLKIPLG